MTAWPSPTNQLRAPQLLIEEGYGGKERRQCGFKVAIFRQGFPHDHPLEGRRAGLFAPAVQRPANECPFLAGSAYFLRAANAAASAM